MLGTDFCAWVQTWLGISVGALWSPSLAEETCQLQIVFAMGFVQFNSVAQSYPTLWNPMDCSTPASLSLTNSRSLLKLMSIKSVMPSNHLILCRPLIVLSIFPSNRVFPNESVLYVSWPKYWSLKFRFSPFKEYSGLISFSIDWLDLLAVQGTLKSLVQHHSSKASILHCYFLWCKCQSIHDNWKNHSFDYIELF